MNNHFRLSRRCSRWLSLLSISACFLSSAPVGWAQCGPTGRAVFGDIKAKIVDETSRPLSAVGLYGLGSNTLTPASLTNNDGECSILVPACLDKALCVLYPNDAFYLYKPGWNFSPVWIPGPDTFRFCNLVTSVTARRAPFTVVSAASYQTVIAPGSIGSLFATNATILLASGTLVANQVPLPETLLSTKLTLTAPSATTAQNARLFYVSPTQVNFAVPSTLPFSGFTELTLKNGNTTHAATALVRRLAPALFSMSGSGQGAAAGVVVRVRPNNIQTYEDLTRLDRTTNQWVAVPIDLGPANEQVFIALFGTGFRLRSGLDSVAVKIGGTDAQVTYAGEQPTFVGVDQANIFLPRSLAGRGELNVALAVEGLAANQVKINIK